MKVQSLEANLVIQAIDNGTLVLEENKRSTRFKLFSDRCLVSGPLVTRRDWSDSLGRPGLMPVIEEIAEKGGDPLVAKPSSTVTDHMDTVYDALQRRLAPEKLFVMHDEKGWLLSSHYSRSVEEANSAAA